MKLAIMQPYFFPYIGYFQLINAVDSFVFYDDVNYINRGWINRNYILGNEKNILLTLQLFGASQNLLINQLNIGTNAQKILSTISHTYKRAPEFSNVYPLLEDIFTQDENNLANFLMISIIKIAKYLNITKNWYVSSEITKDNSLKGQSKIIQICQLLNAQDYINPTNGRSLYDFHIFKAKGLNLSFINPYFITYNQYGKSFVPGLSIIDVMMFNSQTECNKLLKAYDVD